MKGISIYNLLSKTTLVYLVFTLVAFFITAKLLESEFTSYIDRELEKMEFLIKKGGYIPYADHLIPPNSTWENFKYYRDRLNEIIYSTRVL